MAQKSLKKRIQNHFLLIFVTYYLLLFLILIFIRGVEVYFTKKKEISYIAYQISEIIKKNEGTYRRENSQDDVFKTINDRIDFFYQSEETSYSYAILVDNDIFYSYIPVNTKKPFAHLDVGKLNKGFQINVNNWFYWDYFYHEPLSPFMIVVHSQHHFVLFKFLLFWTIVSFPLLFIISLLVSKRLISKVVLPINDIAEVTKLIRKGELKTRVKVNSYDNEVEHLAVLLNETFADLEASFQKISRFNMHAAHELKTPITVIRGQLEVLLRQDREIHEYKESIQKVLHKVTMMGRVIENLLLTTKSTADFKSKFIELPLHEILLDVCEQAKMFGESKKVKVEWGVSENIYILGVKEFIYQIFDNLLMNAIKYKNSSNAKIEVKLSKIDHLVRVVISDNGIGIPANYLDSIFLPFFQGDKQNFEGIGLGLSLVKWMVELHQGSIFCDSEVGNGTNFTIELPTIR